MFLIIASEWVSLVPSAYPWVAFLGVIMLMTYSVMDTVKSDQFYFWYRVLEPDNEDLVEDDFRFDLAGSVCCREQDEFFVVTAYGEWQSLGHRKAAEWGYHCLRGLVLVRQDEFIVVAPTGEEHSLGVHEKEKWGIDLLGTVVIGRMGSLFEITDDGTERTYDPVY